MSERPARTESDLALPEGLEAGMLGGLVVVLVYLVPDLLAGDWLRTPALLGSLLLYGPGLRESPVSPGGLAALYTALHFAAWAIAGFAASTLVSLAARKPELRWLPTTACAVWIVGMVATDFWIASVVDVPPHLWVGSVTAGLALGAYLSWRHPLGMARGQGIGAGTSR